MQQIKGLAETRKKAQVKEEEKKEEEKRKAEKTKKLALDRMVKDKEQREIAKQQKELLQDFVKQQDILAILAKYRRPMQHVFKFFAKQDDAELSDALSQSLNTINFAKFSKFCSIFRIVPELMSTEEMVYLFRQTSKSKLVAAVEGSPAKAKVDPQNLSYDVWMMWEMR